MRKMNEEMMRKENKERKLEWSGGERETLGRWLMNEDEGQ